MPSLEQWNDYFAQSVRTLRSKSALTVAAMAEKLGVDERTYRKYERGIATPQVSYYCWILDQLDSPILRPILEFLHPDAYAGGDDLDAIRSELMHYIGSVAPGRILRQLHHNMISQAADNIVPQMEMLSALQQLPLIYRVMAVRNILDLYSLAEARGELLTADRIPPDMEGLRAATVQAEAACRKMRGHYTTLAAEKEEPHHD